MYGRLVQYTLQGGQRGPPSQPEASGKWAPTRLFPSEAPMCPSALGSTMSTQQNNPVVHKQQQWTNIGKKSVCPCSVLCLYKSALCTMVQCAAILCSDKARLQFDAAECNMSSVQFSVQFFSAMVWCTVQWTWHGFIIS